MIRYKTIEKEAQAEQIIDRSRFIAHIARAYSRDEAEAYIRQIKGAYKDATHNVPCFIIGEKQELMWASDDGEPSGTSGAPMMQMLVREGLTNIVCVVTRYFGGIKLGTGGLVRAYTSSAALALEAAGVHQVRDLCVTTLTIPYTLLGKVQNMALSAAFDIGEITYADQVMLEISYAPEDEERVLAPLRELTAGNLCLSEVEKILK